MQGFGSLNDEHSVLHIARIGRATAMTQRLDEREHEVAHAVEQVLRTQLAEHAPAQLTVGDADGALVGGVGMRPLAVGEGGVADLAAAEGMGGGLFLDLRVVEHLHEKEVGHLTQHIHRISDAGRLPKRAPNRVYFVFNLACNHIVLRFMLQVY